MTPDGQVKWTFSTGCQSYSDTHAFAMDDGKVDFFLACYDDSPASALHLIRLRDSDGTVLGGTQFNARGGRLYSVLREQGDKVYVVFDAVDGWLKIENAYWSKANVAAAFARNTGEVVYQRGVGSGRVRPRDVDPSGYAGMGGTFGKSIDLGNGLYAKAQGGSDGRRAKRVQVKRMRFMLMLHSRTYATLEGALDSPLCARSQFIERSSTRQCVASAPGFVRLGIRTTREAPRAPLGSARRAARNIFAVDGFAPHSIESPTGVAKVFSGGEEGHGHLFEGEL